MTAAAEPVTAVAGWRARGRRPLHAVLGLALAAGLLGWALPWAARTTWGAVWGVLGAVPAATAAGLMLVMTTGLWLYTFTVTGSLPGLGHVRALIVNVSGSAVGNLLPAGGAAGVAATYKQLRSWGFTRREISTSIIVTGIWNLLARLALPVLGVVAMILAAADLNPAVIRAAAAGAVIGGGVLALFVAVLASRRLAHQVAATLGTVLRPVPGLGHLAGGLTDHVLDQRTRTAAVVRRGWLPMTLGMVGFFGMNFMLFWLCLSTVGVQFSLALTFFAFAVSRLLTSVGLTPGGVGISETGVAALLVDWGAQPAAATAGVVLYALYVHFLEVPLGAAGWVAWWLSPKSTPADGAAGAPADGTAATADAR